MSVPAATYVYCIVSSTQPLQTTKRPAGPPGTRKVRVLDIRPHRYLVVSDAPLDVFGEAPLAAKLSDLGWVSGAALAHEAVTESFMSADAVVPMKLFTLFTSDARALEMIRSEWKRLERVVERLAKHEEWGVRLVFDESRAPAEDKMLSASSGVGYLMAKRQHHAASTAHTTSMRKTAAGVLKILHPLVRDSKQRPVTTPAESRSVLLLDAAFLVPKAKAMRFRTSVERHAKSLVPAGYALQLSGPWPAYSFVENS